ncbi:class I SAM-dependent methyltransferase [Campylobacter insulaenigrae]|uniref:Cyclopropane-fatty-acyl-phospholipid synthase, putative n=1 Tax=Campylobacter insulaenigrae NCTC 12927 TaxID=1031564 RepID=A0A0A8H1S5_9BACT|nr:class I SAM-dependent methyltransferase [Campylobacter insulaenigrae]AJC88021.1 cyclopropane-fatty-acyl-phospholipid synthase, putative [Campylobacter insulaenigrae NCTC 12927]MCR6591838.1 class I SAM-dependent methyltransferase [Campylobacter insulaenigrae]MCR6593300.1 class I SAM-dependent methyltransferase [Campylobacter insulaenigrae]VEH94598.1 cyclopropane-fatty-acyl-phospholipid synthase [Campylobacter insulaenigrae]VEJ54471.1 cyclopropane-fatty-acyl-phospholipid synthase [Campylobact
MFEKLLIKKMFKRFTYGDFKVIFWDGDELCFGKNEAKFSLVFKEKIPLKYLFADVSLVFARHYMQNKLDIYGSYDELMKVLYYFSNRNFLKNDKIILSKIHQHQESKNIKSHYDLGNDFYKLWLDETMSYSCAYFKEASDTLYDAQINKINHTLKKLDLKPNEKLLDIGCGWGFLSVKAALEYGVNVVGITISQEQFNKANELVKNFQLENKVEIRLQNYQDLEFKDYFDKVVSVGMFEHVGKDNLDLYFAKVKQVLKPGGSFLLHSILSLFEGKTNAWIDKYIFPGGYLPSLREVISIASESDFHLLLAESLRIHYAKTLDCWYENFTNVLSEVRKKYDEEFIRMWSLYLRSCSSAFRVGSVDLFQFLLTKEINNNLSLTKEYVYK